MAGVLHLWNQWEIQILVLVSFTLQVLLLSFAWMRRRSISRALRILLWFMYLLAEYTATYALGHMSITSCKSAGKQQQLTAFWAPFLLVHLGGQDTITAYAMEDNQLWLRHLLTFAVQALGAAYVLYKNMGSRGPLVAPAVLMYLVGVLKNAERVWALSFSRLEIIRRYLEGVSIEENDKDYSTAGKLDDDEWDLGGVSIEEEENDRDYSTACKLDDNESVLQGAHDSTACKLDDDELVLQGAHDSTACKLDDDELVLQGAHDLLYICLGQFVDDKIYPSRFQNNVMKHFHEKSKTFELVEMQLSLLYDIFYTKAAVIHTWYGRCIRVMSLLATVIAFYLFQFQFQFQFSTDGKDNGYSTMDVVVTYIVAVGALILEIASVLRAMGSTWTCAMLKATEWDWLHNLHIYLRRCVKIVQARRWSSSIGQLNLLYSYCNKGDETSPGSIREKDETSLGAGSSSSASKKDKGEEFTIQIKDSYCNKGDETSPGSIREKDETSLGPGSSSSASKKDKGDTEKDEAASLRSKMVSFWSDGSSRISTGAKELVLKEIQRVVEACKGEEAMMRTYRGQCMLQHGWVDLSWSVEFLKDLTWSTSMEFDESILAWHLATDKFLWHSMSSCHPPLVKATKAVSNYMMFLLVERPYMLPSPVRPTLHLHAKKVLREWHYSRFMERDSHNKDRGKGTTTDEEAQVNKDKGKGITADEEAQVNKDKGTPDEEAPQVLSLGKKLADQLLHMAAPEFEKPGPNKLLRVVFGVWVEMMCYAAHHCSRESHARQLSSGGELITVVWLLTMAEFDRIYYSRTKFKERKHGSFWNFLNFVDFTDFVKSVMTSLRPRPRLRYPHYRYRYRPRYPHYGYYLRR